MVNTVALHSIPPKIFCLGCCQYIAAVFIVNDMCKKREPYVLTLKNMIALIYNFFSSFIQLVISFPLLCRVVHPFVGCLLSFVE